MTFLTLSGNSGNSVDRHDGMFTKKFFCYFTRNKSVWLRFPASPWMNLWMIFLNSLQNSSRELYNSFCGLESFKKSPSQGRVAT